MGCLELGRLYSVSPGWKVILKFISITQKVWWGHWTDAFQLPKRCSQSFLLCLTRCPKFSTTMANRCYQVLRSLWFLMVLALGSERTLLKRQTELSNSSEGKQAAKNLPTWVLSWWLMVEREDFWISSSDLHIFSMACAPPQYTHK